MVCKIRLLVEKKSKSLDVSEFLNWKKYRRLFFGVILQNLYEMSQNQFHNTHSERETNNLRFDR